MSLVPRSSSAQLVVIVLSVKGRESHVRKAWNAWAASGIDDVGYLTCEREFNAALSRSAFSVINEPYRNPFNWRAEAELVAYKQGLQRFPVAQRFVLVTDSMLPVQSYDVVMRIIGRVSLVLDFSDANAVRRDEESSVEPLISGMAQDAVAGASVRCLPREWVMRLGGGQSRAHDQMDDLIDAFRIQYGRRSDLNPIFYFVYTFIVHFSNGRPKSRRMTFKLQRKIDPAQPGDMEEVMSAFRKQQHRRSVVWLVDSMEASDFGIDQYIKFMGNQGVLNSESKLLPFDAFNRLGIQQDEKDDGPIAFEEEYEFKNFNSDREQAVIFAWILFVSEWIDSYGANSAVSISMNTIAIAVAILAHLLHGRVPDDALDTENFLDWFNPTVVAARRIVSRSIGKRLNEFPTETYFRDFQFDLKVKMQSLSYGESRGTADRELPFESDILEEQRNPIASVIDSLIDQPTFAARVGGRDIPLGAFRLRMNTFLEMSIETTEEKGTKPDPPSFDLSGWPSEDVRSSLQDALMFVREEELRVPSILQSRFEIE